MPGIVDGGVTVVASGLVGGATAGLVTDAGAVDIVDGVTVFVVAAFKAGSKSGAFTGLAATLGSPVAVAGLARMGDVAVVAPVVRVSMPAGTMPFVKAAGTALAAMVGAVVAAVAAGRVAAVAAGSAVAVVAPSVPAAAGSAAVPSAPPSVAAVAAGRAVAAVAAVVAAGIAAAAVPAPNRLPSPARNGRKKKASGRPVSGFFGSLPSGCSEARPRSSSLDTCRRLSSP